MFLGGIVLFLIYRSDDGNEKDESLGDKVFCRDVNCGNTLINDTSQANTAVNANNATDVCCMPPPSDPNSDMEDEEENNSDDALAISLVFVIAAVLFIAAYAMYVYANRGGPGLGDPDSPNTPSRGGDAVGEVGEAGEVGAGGGKGEAGKVGAGGGKGEVSQVDGKIVTKDETPEAGQEDGMMGKIKKNLGYYYDTAVASILSKKPKDNTDPETAATQVKENPAPSQSGKSRYTFGDWTNRRHEAAGYTQPIKPYSEHSPRSSSGSSPEHSPRSSPSSSTESPSGSSSGSFQRSRQKSPQRPRANSSFFSVRKARQLASDFASELAETVRQYNNLDAIPFDTDI